MRTLRLRWTPLSTLQLIKLLRREADLGLRDAFTIVEQFVTGEGPTVIVAPERIAPLAAVLLALGLRANEDADDLRGSGGPDLTLVLVPTGAHDTGERRDRALAILAWRPLDKRALTRLLHQELGFELGVVQRLRGRLLVGEEIAIAVPEVQAAALARRLRACSIVVDAGAEPTSERPNSTGTSGGAGPAQAPRG
jgi:hypothetical protein